MFDTTYYQSAPDLIVLRKLAPREQTEPGDKMLCDGHLYPVALYGTAAGEYEAVIYRESHTKERTS